MVSTAWAGASLVPAPGGDAVEQVAEQLGRFRDLGASRGFLQLLDLADLDHLDVIASDVAPLLD